MLIPKEIKGKNRIRDFKICLDYINGKSPEEIKLSLERRSITLTVRRIYKIIYDNAEFINPRIGWNKSKRLWHLQKMAEDAGPSKKDKADLIAEIRKEVDGESDGKDMRPVINIINYAQPNNDSSRSVQTGIPSVRNFTSSVEI